VGGHQDAETEKEGAGEGVGPGLTFPWGSQK
jgi:hypothetical protein